MYSRACLVVPFCKLNVEKVCKRILQRDRVGYSPNCLGRKNLEKTNYNSQQRLLLFLLVRNGERIEKNEINK